MGRKFIQIASVFSMILVVVTLIYSNKLIQEKISHSGVIFYLTIITVLTAATFLFFKRFLKYYYNFKDSSNLIFFIIGLEAIHNVFTMVFYDNLKIQGEWYLVFSTLAALISAGLLGFYVTFALKLINLSKKSTRLMKPFAFTFIIIPVVITVSFLISLITGDDLFASLEFNDSMLFLTALKVVPFFLLTFVYIRAYQRRKWKHSY